MLNHELNQIALKLNKSLVISPSSSTLKSSSVTALIADLAQLGFTLSPEALTVVKTFAPAEVKVFLDFLVPELKALIGGYVHHEPLFKNFPFDVPDNEQYFQDRLSAFFCSVYEVPENTPGLTTLSCGHNVNTKIFNLNLFSACPLCQRQVAELKNAPTRRSRTQEHVNLKVITLASEETIESDIRGLLKSKVSLNDNQKEAIDLFFKIKKNSVEATLPTEFIFKETMAFTVALTLKHTDLKPLVGKYLKTATDVLRVACALSGGDISLSEKTRFKLTNSQRKFILKSLNEITHPIEDLLRYRQKWLHLAEYLHVGAYQVVYPQAFTNIQILRNEDHAIETFNRKAGKISVKKELTAEDVVFFTARPGEFMRRLDYLLCKAPVASVLENLPEMVMNVSTPMILRLIKHLAKRHSAQEFRAFVPKGNIASLFLLEGDTRKHISPEVISEVIAVLEEELANRFAIQGELKNVFINPELKNILVPLSQRSASKTLETIERGSRVKFDAATNTVRMFIYWKENPGIRVDVDLSAVAYDANWQQVAYLSFHNLEALGAKHSGDITSAPFGASEFIDIPLETFRKNNIRYVTMNIINFTGQQYNTFECFAGIMERENANQGEVFEASTVKTKFDLAGDSNSNMPLILDLETNTMIWCDMTLSDTGSRLAVKSNAQIQRIGRYVLSLQENRPNLCELFFRHAAAHGARVHTIKRDDIQYDLVADETIAKNITELMSRWI